MISFNYTELDKFGKSARAVCDSIIAEYGAGNCEFTLSHGCLLARIFDDEVGYIFLYPVKIEPDASEDEAIAEIGRYAMHEDLSEIFCDVQVQKLASVLRGARHAELHAQDAEGSRYMVVIKNELAMLGEDISMEHDGLTLCPLNQSHAKEYKRLLDDAEHNKYYGYNAADDSPTGRAEDIVAVAERDFRAGRSLTLAVSDGKRFVGEGVLFGFDGRGNAELSVRVVSKFCNMGYGRRILEALIALSAEMGLASVTARVDRRNKYSLMLFDSSEMKREMESDEIVRYFLSLYN